MASDKVRLLAGIRVIAEPGRYFAAASMMLVTSIVGHLFNNRLFRYSLNQSECRRAAEYHRAR